jgi:hypothetical protein
MKARCFAPTILALLVAAGSARGEGIAGRLSIAVQAGTQSEIAGDVTSAVSGLLAGKPATIDAKRYRDVYSPDLRLQAMIGVGVAPRIELFARGTYYAVKAASVQGGTFEGKPLFACFEPSTGAAGAGCEAPTTREYGLELGLRYYIAPQSRLKSYVAAVGGLRHTDELLVSFSIPDAGTAVLHVPFSKAGNAAAYGADLGFLFDLTPHLFLGVDTGLRYQQAPAGFEALPELGAFDARTARWTAPVTATLGVRF